MKFLSLCGLMTTVSAFTSSNTASRSTTALTDSKTEDLVSVQTSKFSPSEWLRAKQPKDRCGPCPNNEDDVMDTLEDLFSKNNDDRHSIRLDSNNMDKDMDRREAAFALLGTLWATTTAVAFPAPANAVYGAEPKIEMPNMLEQMNNRANGQCLVESLGNRECLVWMDPDNKLYEGANTQKLLLKVDTSSAALAKIPELVEAKKWMGVKGIVAGPMGELLTTMNLLSPLSTQEADKSGALAKQVKLEIFAISAAADRKDGAAVMKSHQGATDALVAFVRSL